MLRGGGKIAMEYSPGGALPRASKVDAGTLEMVRGFGVEVASSADLVQFATQRWTPAQLESHRQAALGLDRIVHDAFAHVGEQMGSGLTEYELAEFIRERFQEEGLEASEGPVVAVNQHSSDPHFDPKPEDSVLIARGDWLLIDLWARLPDTDAMYADITWTGFVGEEPGPKHREVFAVVIGARDAALAEIERAFREAEVLRGWQLDKVARDHITRAGYGDYFNHRLGHSLGREAHGNAVNLDSWETFDTRELIPGIAVTVEPGIYLPQFGVRSEIDVFISETGPEVTTEVQREIVLIGQ
jgi:Xaa-Pro aminopeptidase